MGNLCLIVSVYLPDHLVCYRYKSAKQRTGSTPGQAQPTGQPSQAPGKHKTGGEKPEKGDKQQKRPQTPFHHRSIISDDPSIETETTSGQRLAMRGQDGAGRFSSIRSTDISSIQKVPQLHSGVVSTGPSEQANSPQPPPLSPHLCERSEESGEVIKNPSTPNSQHFYQPPPEPCLVSVKASGGEESIGSEGLNQHFHSHHTHSGGSSYSESPEPTVYVGAAVNLEEDSSHTPWRFFKLPHRKEADLPTPLLPGDKLRDETSASQDSLVSVTE